MDEKFDEDVFCGYLLRGDLPDGIRCLGRFPEQAERYARYQAVFEQEKYPVCAVEAPLDQILSAYQAYYRAVFYLRADPGKAAEALRDRLTVLLQTDGKSSLDMLEQHELARIFREKGYQFLGGKTGGYYGPYIWKTTEAETFEVELPDGIQAYTVRFLDDFLSKSWLDYISFGRMSTGGWAGADGIINCIKGSYDVESENFQVSLLKHEAQHTRDLAAYQDLSSEVLEYRAKLVELIYSRERNLLVRFLGEAGRTDLNSGHSLASARLAENFSRLLHKAPGELHALPIAEIQASARTLFAASAALCRGSLAET